MPKCWKESVRRVRIRRATAADIPAMLQLEREIPTSANWSHEHYKSLFTTTTSGSSVYLILALEDSTQSEDSGSVPISPRTSPILAYLVAHCIDRDWELQYIVVAKKFQRRGLATLLLQELVQNARSQNAQAIFLEVRESNQSARALYKKAGFEPSGQRKNYYPNPRENAVLLRLPLS